MQRYNPLYPLLLEAFGIDDMERAVKIIKSLLQKKLGTALVKSGKSENFRKRRGQELFGLKYFLKGTAQAIRFNWDERVGREINSIDIFTKKRSMPTWTIGTRGQNSIQIINLIIDTLYGRIDKAKVKPAEREKEITKTIPKKSKRGGKINSIEGFKDFVSKNKKEIINYTYIEQVLPNLEFELEVLVDELTTKVIEPIAYEATASVSNDETKIEFFYDYENTQELYDQVYDVIIKKLGDSLATERKYEDYFDEVIDNYLEIPDNDSEIESALKGVRGIQGMSIVRKQAIDFVDINNRKVKSDIKELIDIALNNDVILSETILEQVYDLQGWLDGLTDKNHQELIKEASLVLKSDYYIEDENYELKPEIEAIAREAAQALDSHKIVNAENIALAILQNEDYPDKGSFNFYKDTKTLSMF